MNRLYEDKHAKPQNFYRPQEIQVRPTAFEPKASAHLLVQVPYMYQPLPWSAQKGQQMLQFGLLSNPPSAVEEPWLRFYVLRKTSGGGEAGPMDRHAWMS